MKMNPQIIVSLTSFPKRIEKVDKVIKTLLIQSKKPDRIILWLSKKEFPKLDNDLPVQLTTLKRYGLQIRWVEEDLKPHKKYYYAMQEFPNDIVITVDDDMYYHSELVEALYNSYISHPNAISCARVNLICCNEQNVIAYREWKKNFSFFVDMEAMDLLPVGCGGVLYPPSCFDVKRLCDIDNIQHNCLFQDDLWLKVNELIEGIPTVLVTEHKILKPMPVKGSQETALCESINVTGNDITIENLNRYLQKQGLRTWYQYIYETGYTVKEWLETKKNKVTEIVNKIIGEEKVYIYGAGEGAKSTYGCLKLQGLEKYVHGFVVTNKKNNPTQLFAIDVIDIAHFKDKDAVIIVSTAQEIQGEIISTLQKCGCKRIFTVSDLVIGEYNYLKKRMDDNINEFFISGSII